MSSSKNSACDSSGIYMKMMFPSAGYLRTTSFIPTEVQLFTLSGSLESQIHEMVSVGWEP